MTNETEVTTRLIATPYVFCKALFMNVLSHLLRLVSHISPGKCETAASSLTISPILLQDFDECEIS